MRRALRRALRNAVPEIVDMPENYVPRHAKLVEFMEEIFAEVCEDLSITAEFMAEVVFEHAVFITGISKKIHFPKIPMPEIPLRKFPAPLADICKQCYAIQIQG